MRHFMSFMLSFAGTLDDQIALSPFLSFMVCVCVCVFTGLCM